MQWDAPRHLWFPTRAALSRLAVESGVIKIPLVHDSVSFPDGAIPRYRANVDGFFGNCFPYGRRRD